MSAGGLFILHRKFKKSHPTISLSIVASLAVKKPKRLGVIAFYFHYVDTYAVYGLARVV
jgi:hypothetical protein